MDVARMDTFCFLLVFLILQLIQGNLISIGPGVYPSNRTVEKQARTILVLGSCEFMHNGHVTNVNLYVATYDWLILQIWRPVPDLIGKLELVHSQLIQPNRTMDVIQLWYDDGPLRVLKGDKVGFTQVNDTFPIPYTNNSRMTADLWQHSVGQHEATPALGDIVTFDEVSHPYHFSITVTFKADRPNIFGQLINASIDSNGSVPLIRPQYSDFQKEIIKQKMENANKMENENMKYIYDGLESALMFDQGKMITKGKKPTYIVHDIGEHDHPFENIENQATTTRTMLVPSKQTLSATTQPVSLSPKSSIPSNTESLKLKSTAYSVTESPEGHLSTPDKISQKTLDDSQKSVESSWENYVNTESNVMDLTTQEYIDQTEYDIVYEIHLNETVENTHLSNSQDVDDYYQNSINDIFDNTIDDHIYDDKESHDKQYGNRQNEHTEDNDNENNSLNEIEH